MQELILNSQLLQYLVVAILRIHPQSSYYSFYIG